MQLAASFAAAAVGAIILLLSPFMMTLAVDVLTHSIHGEEGIVPEPNLHPLIPA